MSNTLDEVAVLFIIYAKLQLINITFYNLFSESSYSNALKKEKRIMTRQHIKTDLEFQYY